MVVTLDATGTGVTGGDVTLTVASPAGTSGDLLIFFMCHDDFSDGTFSASSPPTTTTRIATGEQVADDSRGEAFFSISDQDAGEDYTFTWPSSEGFAAICCRFSGHNATTPIQGSTGIFSRGPACTDEQIVNKFGSMVISMTHSDSSNYGSGSTAPWSATLGSIGTGTAFTQHREWDVGEEGYPFGNSAQPQLRSSHAQPTGGVAFHIVNFQFVIAPAETDLTISGITKDKDGTALVSCQVILIKRIGDNDYRFVEEKTSSGSDGTYSFTITNDSDAKFFVYSFKDDTPHVMDATDHVLTPA